jgi:hypothetical protein
MQLKYKAGVGKLIWVMTTCQPDIALTSVKLSQSNSSPAEHHYHGLKHAIRYVYITRIDGIYFWQTWSCPDLPEGPLPSVNSNHQDLLLDERPDHNSTTAVAIEILIGTPASKPGAPSVGSVSNWRVARLQTKLNSNQQLPFHQQKVEFMAAVVIGRMCLFVQSILWDLDIPQEAANIAHEDNDGCTAMGNAQKPNAHTPHINIKYFALCDWLNGILLFWKESTHPLILWITLPKYYLEISFIDMPTTYLDMSHQNTHQYINRPYQRTATPFETCNNRFLRCLQPPLQLTDLLQLLQHGILYLYMMNSKVIRGSSSFGMSDTIHNYVMDCGGVLVYVLPWE